MNPLFGMVVDKVRRCTKCNNNQGRGRYFLRLALQNKILSVPVDYMGKNIKLQEVTDKNIITEFILRLALQNNVPVDYMGKNIKYER